MTRKVRPIRVDGDVAYVPLTKGYEAVIDADDAPRVSGWNWCARISRKADGSICTIYAMRRATFGTRKVALEMHRVIAATPDGMETDHRDGDGLSNRKTNLRNATLPQNRRNARTRTDNTSGAKGVHWCKTRGRWVARIKMDRQSRYLGCFHSLDEAAAAYAKASADLHGEFGRVK